MKLSCRTINNVCIIPLPEKLINGEAKELDFYADEMLDNFHCDAILLDMKSTHILDSSGISVIVALFKKTENMQIGFALCHLNERLLEKFQTTRLDKLLDIYETEQEAIEKFSQLEAGVPT